MRRAVPALAAAMAVAVLAAGVLLGNALLRDRALSPEAPAARLARLAPHWRLTLPEGAGGPSPVVVLLPGCDGPGDNMGFWAGRLARAGWASLVVDSHAPRGLDDLQAWRLVCAGQALSGAERAGDVAVALAALDAMEGVDGRRVALLGASHGGWTAMELLGLLAREAPPPGLAAWPEPPAAARGRFVGAVLLYPYCGPLNRAAEAGPEALVLPVLMVLAGEDTIVSAARCEAVAARLAEAGVPVGVRVLPGADHGFDQRLHAALSTLDFDPGATAQAAEIVTDFLAALPGARGSAQ